MVLILCSAAVSRLLRSEFGRDCYELVRVRVWVRVRGGGDRVRVRVRGGGEMWYGNMLPGWASHMWRVRGVIGELRAGRGGGW